MNLSCALLGALLPLFGLLACAPEEASRPPAQGPNLLVIVADDLGYGDLGAYGSPDALTPRLDALAAEGLLLSDFYVASPMCSPSRASLLTGRTPTQHGLGQALTEAGARGLSREETLLPELLAEHGYRTGLVGKWHLGHEAGERPLDRGFDDFYGMLRGSSGYTRHSWRGEADLWRGERAVQAEGRYATELFTEEAIAFVETSADAPWFLMLSYSAPHLTDERRSPPAPAEFRTRFDAEVLGPERAAYLAAVAALDAGVGELLDELARLELEQDTLVVFLSDNGALPPWGSNAPLSGIKDTLDEGGVRVPCLLRWPARLGAGEVVATPLLATDLLPTLLSAAGVEKRPERPLAGLDLLPFLEHAEPLARDAIAFEHHSRRLDDEGQPRHDRSLRSGPWRLDLDRRGRTRLFDLDRDPGQTRDLAAEHPELSAELRERLEELTREG